MNIIKRELRANLKSIIIWSIAIAFLVTVWMVEFEAFAENPAIDEFMNSMPQGILAAMGMGDSDFTSLEGFISAILLYIYLILGIQAVLLGSSIISKEERNKTAEYLFSLPISRQKIIIRKTIFAIINILILNIITLISLVFSTMNYDQGENFYSFISLLIISILIFQLTFLSIGMLVASINKRYKKSGNISVSILMITFLISSLINMVDSLDFLKYITPFKYFDPSYILKQLRLDPIYLGISLFIIILCMGGTFIFYPNRDLYI